MANKETSVVLLCFGIKLILKKIWQLHYIYSYLESVVEYIRYLVPMNIVGDIQEDIHKDSLADMGCSIDLLHSLSINL